MSVTFAVDDVVPATEPLETVPLAATLGDHLAAGLDPATRVVPTEGAPPLAFAVHRAFSEHRPLVLSPEAIWTTIAQGVAQHVRLHAEALRPRLVRHEGKAVLTVTRRGPMPTDAASWAAIATEFDARLGEHVGPGLGRLFANDFSTSTPADRIASRIVLLDAMSPYFDLVLACVCGIPEVTVLGEPRDWRRIRARIDVIAELGLAKWSRSLVPIVDAFVAASEGAPDRAFFERMYKPREAYGWDRVTGSIARLYPYLVQDGRLREENPLLDLPIDEPRATESQERWYTGPGVRLEDLPAPMSSVPIEVRDLVEGARLPILLEGGMMAVAVDARGALRPMAGYVVRRATLRMTDILDRIERDHATARRAVASRAFESRSAELCEMADRFDSAELRLSGGRIARIRGERERTAVKVPTVSFPTTVSRLVDLPDGRYLGTTHYDSEIVLGRGDLVADGIEPGPTTEGEYSAASIRTIPPEGQTSENADAMPFVGKSLTEVLAHVLDHDGEPPPPSGRVLLEALPEMYRRPPPPPRGKRGH